MTAVIAYIEDDRAHLLSDGGLFEPDGRMVGTVAKAVIMPEKQTVMVARGALMITVSVRAQVEAAPGGFDELLSTLPAQVAAAYANAARYGMGDEDIDLVLVGWSQARDRPEAYCFATHSAFGPPRTVKPLERAASACVFVAPSDADMVTRLRRHGVDIWDPEPDPAKHGLAVMREQRSARGGNPHHPDASNVGGFCQITTVTRDGITTRVLEKWPEDRPGEIVEKGSLTCPERL